MAQFSYYNTSSVIAKIVTLVNIVQVHGTQTTIETTFIVQTPRRPANGGDAVSLILEIMWPHHV